MGTDTVVETFAGTERFSVIRRLGEGGMGVVYLAHDRERDGVVALKTLPAPEPSKILRLKTEFRALSGVTHPNLVQLYELVSDGRHWFFTMEYVEGLDFLQYVQRTQAGALAETVQVDDVGSAASLTLAASSNAAGRHAAASIAATAAVDTLPSVGAAPAMGAAATVGAAAPSVATPSWGPRSEREAAAIEGGSAFAVNEERLRPALRQLVGAIQSLHAAGMLHLDIKPSNVLVTPAGRVVVLDFGLVTHFRASEPEPASQRETVSGTPAYMAPEQVRHGGLCEASDWYGVGAMLYEVLTRRLPFAGTTWEILRAKIEREPPPPRAWNRLVPADLDDLCSALLKPQPEHRLGGTEILRRAGIDAPHDELAPSGSTLAAVPERARELIGRAREARALREVFAEVRAGNAATALVHGASGMGKTALVEDFLDDVAGAALVLRGRCYERESVPYKAFDSLIDGLCGKLAALPPDQLTALLPPQTAALARLFPVLTQLPGVEARLREAAAVPDALERRRQGFAGLRELLQRLAAQRPLVVFLDDLQWGDLDSGALLSDILRPPSAPPLLLLGSYRDEDVARSGFLQGLLSATPAEVGAVRDVLVGPLSEADARSLALAGLDAADPERDARAAHVARESGGHPYFVAELVRELATSAPASGRNPALSLDGVIHRRVERLPQLARDLLEVATIAGRPLSQTLLLSAQRAGASADRLAEESALATLQASHMLRTSGARAEDQVEAYHDRVRETVAAHLSGERQRAVHRKLALALEASDSGDAEELAPHFHGAGDRDRAAHYASRAAENAEQALAFDRAAAFHRMALDCSEGSPSSVTQPWKERLAEALKNAGRAADAAAAYRRAAETAATSKALELRRRAAEQLLIGGHLDEGLELLGTVLGAVDMRLASSPSRALASVVAQRLFLKLRGLKYEVRPPGAVHEDDLTRIDTCWSVAVGLSMVDNVRAADFQARQLLLSLRSGDLERITRALTFEVGFVAGPGSAAAEASAKLLQKAGELAQRVGTPYATGFHTLMSGVREYLAGCWKRAFDFSEAAEQTLRERCSGLTWEVTNSQRFALGSLMYMGDLPEVLRRLPVLLRRAHDRGNLYVATDLRTRIALPWLALDDPGRVEHEVEDALARWTDKGFHLQHFNSLMALGQKDLYTGHPERARDRLVQQAKPLGKSLVLRMQVPRIEVVQLRARLALAIAAGRKGSEAQALLRDVTKEAAAIDKEAAPWAMPLAALLHASVAAARRDTTSAIDLAERAARGFDAADMHLHAAVARTRKGELAGGEQGAALIEDARAWMAARDVRAPERMVATLAPGPWGGAG